MLNKKTIAIAVACAALLGGIVLALPSSDDGAISDGTSPDAEPSLGRRLRNVLTGSSDEKRLPWQAGEKRAYSLVMSTNLMAEGAQPVLKVDLEGTWRLVALEVGSQGTVLSAHLDVTRLDLNSATPKPVDLDAAKAEFNNPMFFTLASDGGVRDVRVLEGTSSLVDGFLKSLAAHYQFNARAFGQASWSGKEVDSSGRYVAHYDREGDGHYVRTKEKYLAVLGASMASGSLQTKLEVDHSRMDVHFANGIESSFVLDEQLHVVGPHISLTSVNTMRMELESRGMDTDVLTALLAVREGLPSQDVFNRQNAEAREELARHKRGGYRDMKTLLQRVDNLTEKDDGAERTRLFHAATALMRDDPKVVQETLDILRTKPDEAAYLISAMGFAGSPAAQHALFELYDENLYDLNMQRLMLQSVSFAPAPQWTTFERLRDLSSDPVMGPAALYGAGTTISHMSSKDQQLEALSFLTDGLKEAPSDVDRVHHLKALANAAQEESLPAVIPMVNRDNAAVRASAMYTMQSLPQGEGDRILAHRIAHDPSYRVRTVAARVAAQREPTEVVAQALLERVKSEAAVDARRQIIATIVSWGPDAPHMQEAMDWIANNEPNETLRRLVQVARAD